MSLMPEAPAADTINVLELGRAIRRGWRWVVSWTLVGAAIGVGGLLFAPRRFAGSASIVVRTTPSTNPSSMLAQLGLGAAVPSLGGAMPLETEISILGSRVLMGKIVDSLHLQAEIRSPKGVAPWALIRTLRLTSAFRPTTYTIDRVNGTSPGYRVSGGGRDVESRPGEPLALREGTIELRPDTALPSHLVLRLLDRDDAITEALKRLSVTKTTGSEVLSVAFKASDSLTAAAVPNALIAEYLVRRHTVDRGTNEHRVSFLEIQIDSVNRQLAGAEDSLRRFQERSGVVLPEMQGKIQLDQAADIRKNIAALDIERGALSQLTTQIASHQMSPRQLAAYPTFLKSPAINELLGQLVKLETDRTQLLERRLDNDPQVVALTESVRNLETQLSGIAAAYKASIDRQRNDLNTQLDTVTHVLGSFPGSVESSERLTRHAKELAQTYAVLQAQLVDSRVAAIGEGGDVKLLDVATPPKKVVFPRILTTIGIGTAAGLFVGIVLALFAGLLGKYVEDPEAIERAMGVPALRMDNGSPLLVGGGAVSKTLLLVPIDGRARTGEVASRLVRTATARAIDTAVLDLSRNGSTPSTAITTDVNQSIRRLESEHQMVIVELATFATDDTAAAMNSERAVLFVVPPGRIERQTLVDAMQTLTRLGVPCAGVVVNRASNAIRA